MLHCESSFKERVSNWPWTLANIFLRWKSDTFCHFLPKIPRTFFAGFCFNVLLSHSIYDQTDRQPNIFIANHNIRFKTTKMRKESGTLFVGQANIIIIFLSINKFFQKLFFSPVPICFQPYRIQLFLRNFFILFLSLPSFLILNFN